MAIQAWNKGLTKADPRVAKYVEGGKKTQFKKGEHISSSSEFKKGMTPWNKGKSRDEETKRKIRETKRLRANTYNRLSGSLSPKWKNDTETLSYRQKHRRIRNILGCPIACSECLKRVEFSKHNHPKIEWANISGEYKMDITDWKALCTSCHSKFDKIILNMHK